MSANLLPCDGQLFLYERVMGAEDADLTLQQLLAEIDWRQEWVTIMGRRVAVPRLTAFYGDAGYRYSGIDHPPRAWTSSLLRLKGVAESYAEHGFNSVLLNRYRDGRDGVSWHSDNEASLGRQPVIASLTFGQRRRFVLRHRNGTRVALEPGHGSCLVMAGDTQDYWQHSVPKSRRLRHARVNLTFRAVSSPMKSRSFAGETR